MPVLFPHGLRQPEGSYRFGLEALMLAAFAVQTLRGRKMPAQRETAVAELGSGCGAALLGVALAQPSARCIGLEREAILVEAARANAHALGLAGRVRFCLTDAAKAKAEDFGPQDLVLANPPWALRERRGRASPSVLREAALCTGEEDDADAFPVFCAAAARLLRHRGAFCAIAPVAALSRICGALECARLGLRRILPLRPQRQKAAHRLLLLAQKDAASEPQLLAPLTLQASCQSSAQASGSAWRWTAQALAFCPWLAPQGIAP